MIPIHAGCRASSHRRSVLLALVAIATIAGGVGGCRSTAQPEATKTETTAASEDAWHPIEVVTATRLNVRAGPAAE